jgi:hypothetical protein
MLELRHHDARNATACPQAGNLASVASSRSHGGFLFGSILRGDGPEGSYERRVCGMAEPVLAAPFDAGDDVVGEVDPASATLGGNWTGYG